ncbi:L,D-transpeptidase [Dietzia sp. B32]|uniref:L,D-transpeptidase n=1 Tax=Dietzia sp. B32 TaxID=2915130 RepID=UPI0021AE079A|nr:L,D-transpeptidase [Dietzia sp. B32]UVE94526.1 L,D-transpeptidase [Dietzia sp. B32]
MRSRPPGRARLAGLSAAALLGAAVAGSATVPTTAPTRAATSDALTTAGAEVTDEPPRPVIVDDRMVRSVARRILVEQGRSEHLTDVDLVARDVLAGGPVEVGEVDRLTRETLLGDGPGAAAAPGTPAPPRCPPTARACVDVDGKRAWMVDDGRITYGPVPVTTGKPGYETARGAHRILRHVRHDHSRVFDSPMPYSTYFTVGGMAFHQGRLDEPSHGCVHLGHHAAAHFFEQLRVGDEIVAF